MTPRRPAFAPFVAWLQACGVLFLALGLLLAWGAAAVNFAGKIRTGEANGMVWLGFAGYGLLATAIVAGLAWLRRMPQCTPAAAKPCAAQMPPEISLNCCSIL